MARNPEVVDVHPEDPGQRRPLASAGDHRRTERAIADLARRQHNRVSADQLRSLGLGQGAIGYRVELGRLHLVHRGVYAVGALDDAQLGRWMAAVLASGPNALLSHFSAGGLWTIRWDPRTRCDVTVLGSARRHRDTGIVAHRMRRIEAIDRTVVQGIPVTSLPLTLLHLAGMLSISSFERVLIRAARLPEFDIAEALDLCSRSKGRRGVRTLKRLLHRDLTAELRALSELEVRFLQLCRRFGIPEPDVNHDVEAMMVDCVWNDEQVVVELDGFEFHRLPSDLRRDNARNRKLVLAGYKVVRFVWQDVVSDSAATARTVLELLGRPVPA